MKKFIIPLLLVSSAAHAAPDWVDDQKRAAACEADGLYCGFGMAVFGESEDKADCLRLAENGASSDLARRISVRIRAESDSSFSQDAGGDTVTARSAVMSVSDIEITDAKKKTYTDSAQATCYAFASASKKSLRELYSAKVSSYLKDIKAAMADASARESSGDRDGALAAYLSVYPLTDKLEQARLVARVAGAQLSEAQDFDPARVRLEVARLINKPVATLDDLAWQLAFILKGQSGKSAEVDLAPLAYQDKTVTTPFSRYFHGILRAALVQTAGWKVDDEYKGGIHPVGGEQPSHLKGNYWPGTDKYRFSVFLMGPDGRISASAQVLVSSGVIAAAGQAVEPDTASASALSSDAETLDDSASSGLELYSWTDKGVMNPVLYAGEAANVYARVNVPAYVTAFFIPYRGGGVLLEENLRVERERANKKLEMAVPLINNMKGEAGILYVFASTSRLPDAGAGLDGSFGSEAKDAFIKAATALRTSGAKVAERRTVVTFSDSPASVRRSIIRPYIAPLPRPVVIEEKPSVTVRPVREKVIYQPAKTRKSVRAEEVHKNERKERAAETRARREPRRRQGTVRGKAVERKER